MSITPKQARFVAEYLIDLNATQAAIRAGYSKNTARSQGVRLLTNANVEVEIAKGKEAQTKRLGIQADDVLCELAKIGFSNMLDYVTIGPDGDAFVDLSKLTRDQAAAISEVTVEDFKDGRGEDARDVRRVKFKLSDKRAALNDLGRHFKLFTDLHEHTGKDGGPIETQEVSPRERIAGQLTRLAATEAAGNDTKRVH